MNTAPETIQLNTAEGKAFALEHVHEKVILLSAIVDSCRKAICKGDMRTLHAELCAIEAISEECDELMEACSG